MIITNKLRVDINNENIDRDFDIYRVSKSGSGNLDKTNILDIPVQYFKAKSVVYTWGRNCFVLFNKGKVDHEELKKVIQQEHPECIVEKLDILDREKLKEIYFGEELLIQLLLNSIRVPNTERFTYNNLSGKLFYMFPEWRDVDKKTGEIKMIYALEVKVTKEMCLQLSVKTYSKNKSEKCTSAAYMFDKSTGYFRRVLKSDECPNDQKYIFRNYSSNHNTVEYLNFSSYDTYTRCKVGVFTRVMNDIERYLGEYLKVANYMYEDYDGFDIKTDGILGFENKDYTMLLKNKGVTIVDEVQEVASRNLMIEIQRDLNKYYNIDIKNSNKLNEETYNLRIIHNSKYYEQNKQEEDPYKMNLDNHIVQHVTMEDFSLEDKKESPSLKKIIQEVIIKGDIKDRKISIANWSKCLFETTWTFVIREKYWVDNKKTPNFRYYRMKVDTDGTFDLDSFNDEEMIDNQEIIAIEFAYKNNEKDYLDQEIEGLLYRSIDNIQVVIKTPFSTMPNYKKLENALRLTQGDKVVDIDEITNGIMIFKDNYEEYIEYADMLVHKLQGQSKYIKQSELLKLMEFRKYKKASKALNRFIHENLGIWISPEIRDSAFEEDFNLGSICDIKYFYQESQLYYFVGTKRRSLNQSVHNASTVRKVIALGGHIEFDKLMQLMAVEFVRNGQYTVTPFPYKYLREYQKANK